MLMFIFAQLMGMIGFILFTKSVRKREKEKILLFQVISFSFYTIQYFLIGAFSGTIVYLINVIRCLTFYLNLRDGSKSLKF